MKVTMKSYTTYNIMIIASLLLNLVTIHHYLKNVVNVVRVNVIKQLYGLR